MTDFVPQDTDFEARVRESFARQGAMETIGARLRWVAPGAAEIELPFRADLTQQHGYLHAGIVTAVVDSACGYAAMSLTPPGADVLSVEFKINLLSPAAGELLVARAREDRRHHARHDDDRQDLNDDDQAPSDDDDDQELTAFD